VIPFFLFAYFAIVRAEEDYLQRKFGSVYATYCRQVNRFVPSLAGVRRTLAGVRFDWKKLVRKEYGTPFVWTSCALALLVYERTVAGMAISHNEIIAFQVVWAVLLAAYVTARVMKKRGVLGTG
jgi:hypothetical protein